MNKYFKAIARLLKIGFRNPKDATYVMGIANSVAEQIENPDSDCRCFPHVDYLSISEESHRLTFQLFPGIGASVTLVEAAALASLLKLSRAKRVFEFGTYKGVSTTQLALNIPEGGMVFTLDLPEDHPVYRDYGALGGETKIKVLVPDELGSKVTYLRADSAEFDTTPYQGTMDLVFVDGYHSYEYVKNDTEKGWEMLRPGGIIAWHDCEPGRPEVVRYLKSFSPLPKLVTTTFLAYAVKPL